MRSSLFSGRHLTYHGLESHDLSWSGAPVVGDSTWFPFAENAAINRLFQAECPIKLLRI
jgi:hypothetical protein